MEKYLNFSAKCKLKEKFDKEFFDIQKPVYTSENPKISNILENISINIDSVICAVDGFNRNSRHLILTTLS